MQMWKKNTWRLVIKDLIEVKPYFYWITGLFMLSILIGFFVELPNGTAILKEIVSGISTKTGIAVPLAIIWNNLLVAVFGITLGIFFGFFPLFATTINGLIVGSVMRDVLPGNIWALWKIVPHGIFELPAIMLTFAIGMKLGLELKQIKKNAILALRLFAIIILPLIFLAGVIEGALFLLMS